MAILRNATVSVDVFFTLSGFFAAYGFLFALMNKKNKIFVILISYINRYFRLLPLIIFAMLFQIYFIPFLTSGSIMGYAKQYK